MPSRKCHGSPCWCCALLFCLTNQSVLIFIFIARKIFLSLLFSPSLLFLFFWCPFHFWGYVCLQIIQHLSIQFFLSIFVKKNHKGWLNLTILLLRKLRLRIFCKSPKTICPSDCKSSDLPLNFLSHHLWTTEDRGLFLLENNFILTWFYTYWVRCLIFLFYSVVLSLSLGKFHIWCKTTDYIILLVINLICCASCLLFSYWYFSFWMFNTSYNFVFLTFAFLTFVLLTDIFSFTLRGGYLLIHLFVFSSLLLSFYLV